VTDRSNSSPTQPSLRRSLAIQMRVIGALLMREVLTRYGRRNIGFMWLFFEPMIFTAGVTAMWAVRGAKFSTVEPVPFLVVGYSTVLLWRNGASRCARAIEPNLSLLYHRNVKVIDLFAARLLLEIAGGTVSFVVISLGAIACGWMKLPADLLTMAAAWLLLSWFAISLGLVVGALTERSEGFERIWHVITYLLFPLSGAFFMVDWLPKPYQEMALWVPMIHAVEMLRDGYYGPIMKTYYSVGYLSLVNTVMLLVGLLLVRKTRSFLGTHD
jgi:capsular polysaccharide transport system permease protein